MARARRPVPQAKLVAVRRISQGIFLALWAILLILASTQRAAWLPRDLLFRLDPLLLVLVTGGARVLQTALLLALGTVVLTLVLGRVFCGWICPLGTLLDGVAWLGGSRLRGAPAAGGPRQRRTWKFYFLAALLVTAALGATWPTFADPLVILTRGIAVGALPPATAILHAVGLPVTVRTAWDALWPAAFLLGVLALALRRPRYWCRNLCPLGALLALLSRFSLFRLATVGCPGCHLCFGDCRMGLRSDDLDETFGEGECIRCFTCVQSCGVGSIQFRFQKGLAPLPPVSLERRALLASLAAGVALVPILNVSPRRSRLAKNLVRPPFAPDEPAFLDLCIRCGACLAACPTGALQPVTLEGGLAALWTPRIQPLVGGCAADCNRCSTVCPTGAIGPFQPEDKLRLKMGTVDYAPHRCIAATHGEICLRCTRICPTDAIPWTEEGPAPHPTAINLRRCTGCGLCVTECYGVSRGRPALTLTSFGRNQPVG